MRKLFILLVLVLTACSGVTDTVLPPKPDTITCVTAYRASVDQPIEQERSITFADSDAEESVRFTDMVFHATYSTGEVDNERALRLWVSDLGDSSVYQTQLYQLDPGSGPQNQFRGGHGFTGLNYSYHPVSNAELQFWCTAAGEGAPIPGSTESENEPPVPTSYPNEVDWGTAVEILNTGEVEVVTQLHSLDVTLTMKDGAEIHTVEPGIDAIFQEVERCGQPCAEIVVATE